MPVPIPGLKVGSDNQKAKFLTIFGRPKTGIFRRVRGVPGPGPGDFRAVTQEVGVGGSASVRGFNDITSLEQFGNDRSITMPSAGRTGHHGFPWIPRIWESQKD
jgi:hypothetical protein